MTTPRAYSYVRMSTPEQMHGDSFRRQIEASRAFAAQRGLPLDEHLQDLGVSAYRGSNQIEGALANFLALVRSGNVPPGSFLIVESLDRLSREQPHKALVLFLELVQRGLTIVTLYDGREYSDATFTADWSQLINSLLIMARAHEESAIKSQRVSAAWAAKRNNGNQRPITARCPAWLELIDNKFVVIEERAKTVRQIFDLVSIGYGKQAIAKKLNEEDVPSFTGKGWHASYVQKILTSKAVIGEFQPHSGRGSDRKPIGEPLAGYFPPILETDVFWSTQFKMKGRRRAGGRRGKSFSNLLTGLAKCGHCGATMVHENKGRSGASEKYLVCDSARRGLPCENPQPRVQYAEVERWAFRILHGSIAAETQKSPENGARPSTELDPLKGQLSDIEGKIAVLVDAFSDKPIDAVSEKIKTLDAQRTDLATRIETIEERMNIERDEERQRASKHWRGAIIAMYKEVRGDIKLSDDERYALRCKANAALKLLVSAVIFDGDGYEFVPKEGVDILDHMYMGPLSFST